MKARDETWRLIREGMADTDRLQLYYGCLAERDAPGAAGRIFAAAEERLRRRWRLALLGQALFSPVLAACLVGPLILVASGRPLPGMAASAAVCAILCGSLALAGHWRRRGGLGPARWPSNRPPAAQRGR